MAIASTVAPGKQNTSFSGKLVYGLAGESKIAKWLRKKGYGVIPAYEKIIDTGKGPQIFTAKRNLVAPDLLVWKSHKTTWIEAKRKNAFTYYRIGGRWVTGIDLNHYGDYCEVEKTTPWPVWLLFLQEGGQAKDHPQNEKNSPAGLFGNQLAYLREHESHQSQNHGRHGMVYWGIDDLNLIATLDEVNAAQENPNPKENK